MARKLKISGAVLNLRTHPHNPEIYAALMADLFRQKRAIKLHGERFGMIRSVSTEVSAGGYVSGVITTFVKVEFEGQWFDASDMQEATEERIAEVRIPTGLHPNAASFYFEFNVNTHQLYVQTYSDGKALSARQAHTLFASLAETPEIFEKYGNVHVTVVQSREGLEELFGLPVIKEIRITIYRPNPDIFADDLDGKIEAALAQSNSQSLTIAFEAEPGQSLHPTEEIRGVSEIGLANGDVFVRGRDEKGAVKKSTDQMPAELHDKYDPDNMAEQNAFRRLLPGWAANLWL